MFDGDLLPLDLRAGVLILAEEVLRGRAATPENFRQAAEAEMFDAQPLPDNAFKVELAKRTIVAVLEQLAGGAA